MFGRLRRSRWSSPTLAKPRLTRPALESLEDRVLLYATLGGNWVYGSRITYSFVPDGTSVGGTPSSLFQSLNAKFATTTWQQQFQKAAAVWQAVTNINLAQVSDNGTAIGANGNQQGDSRFGDIRISAIPLGSGTLGEALSPPPFNGGTNAGDIIMNSTTNWQINSNYDLLTVAIHEFGHALGMGHSQITSAVMYAYYNGLKQSLTSDDSSGIQSIYGLRQNDVFDTGTKNDSYTTPTNLNSYIDANGQISIGGLDVTTITDGDWFLVTVPASTSGTMSVTMQSENLSSLSPKLAVFTTSLGLKGQVASNNYGATINVSVSGVTAGQSYLIRASGNAGGNMVGGYGLLVNFGSQYQPPVPPPYTVVPQQPDQGGGSSSLGANSTDIGDSAWYHQEAIQVGEFSAWGDSLTIADFTAPMNKRPVAGAEQGTASTTLLGTGIAVLPRSDSDQPSGNLDLQSRPLLTMTDPQLATTANSAVLQALDSLLLNPSKLKGRLSLLGDEADFGELA